LTRRLRATILSRGDAPVIALALLALAPAMAGAATQSRDNPSDAPGDANAKSDLRRIAWDVSDTAAALTVSIDAGIPRPDIGVHVLLDTDDNGIADRELVAPRNVDGVQVDVTLRELDGMLSNADCQDLAGKPSGVQGTVTTTTADSLETFTFACSSRSTAAGAPGS
jgi:hypothetical protein